MCIRDSPHIEAHLLQLSLDLLGLLGVELVLVDKGRDEPRVSVLLLFFFDEFLNSEHLFDGVSRLLLLLNIMLRLSNKRLILRHLLIFDVFIGAGHLSMWNKDLLAHIHVLISDLDVDWLVNESSHSRLSLSKFIISLVAIR